MTYDNLIIDWDNYIKTDRVMTNLLTPVRMNGVPCICRVFNNGTKNEYIDFKLTALEHRPIGNEYIFTCYRLPESEKQDMLFGIKKVIFNGPATIVMWNDGTKTVVKTQNDEPFDPEKGLAMAIIKKLNDNKSNYNTKLKKLIKNAEVQTCK